MTLELKSPYKERVADWVTALRSGDYEQGHGWMNFNGKFCCLGVACDIYDNKLWLGDEGSTMRYTLEDTHYSRALPPTLASYYGLQTDGGLFETDIAEMMENERTCSLVHLNDDGYSFAEIADIIESLPKGMFYDDVLEETEVVIG